MKKLAICCLVLALAAIFVPASQAAPRCITFQDYCDQIQFDTSNIGGVTGTALWGDWQWVCSADTTLISGKGGPKLTAATQPVYASGVPFGLNAAFVLRKSDHLMDVYFSGGLAGGIVFGVTNEPWFQAAGSCGFSKPSGKASLVTSLAK